MTSLAGKKVLVTGADGFIGSHLTERLIAESADVRAFCFYNSMGSWGWLDGLPPESAARLEVVLGDIRDERQVREACRETEIVFHLAALVSIPYSYTAPSSFVETNVSGTLNVLEGARSAGSARIINTSTSEVYGTPNSVPIREDHPLKGQSPYSATKIAADKLCEAYALSFGTPVVVLRPFNTYGPRQSARAVLMTILSQLLAGKPRISLGSLTPRRDFTYVADTVDAFVRAATSPIDPGEVIQLGSGRACSIQEVFDIACRVVGVQGEIEVADARVRPAGSEVQVLLSDPSRAQERLGWKAETSLEVGIEKAAEWLKDWMHLYRTDRYVT
ncbi:MAG: GDP-mannose 4,6-dehydratase [Aeromicrobium sp.]